VCAPRCYKQYPRRAIISSYPRGYLHAHAAHPHIRHIYMWYITLLWLRCLRSSFGAQHPRRRRRWCEICSPLYAYNIIRQRVCYTRSPAKWGRGDILLLLYSDVFAAAASDKFIACRRTYMEHRKCNYILSCAADTRVSADRDIDLFVRINPRRTFYVQVHDDDDDDDI
jgi:hypothetical protein